MAIQTYVPLANFTLSSTATSVTINNLPTSGYRDLIFVMRPLANQVNSMHFRINGNSDLINGTRLYEAGSIGANTYSGGAEISYITTNESLITWEFFDYNQTDRHKSIIVKEYEPGRYTGYKCVRWASTSAINSFSFTVESGWALVAGASFELYGIAG